MRVAFDSRPAAAAHGVGHYTRCLLDALRETVPEKMELVESRRPHIVRARRFDLFHSPWMEGAVLRCQCPMVVTLHDLDALTRRSERLRRGGMHMRLRHLALQRAAHVIVHTDAMAHDVLIELGLERERVVVIPQVPDPIATGDVERSDRDAGPAGACGAERSMLADDSRTWSWEDVARATWQVYQRALSGPPRPFISRPRAASAPLGSS